MKVKILETKKTKTNEIEVCLVKAYGKYAVIAKEWIDKEVPLDNFVWTYSFDKAMNSKPTKPNTKTKYPFWGWNYVE